MVKHNKLPPGMTFVEKQAEMISLGVFHFLQFAPGTCDSLILFYFFLPDISLKRQCYGDQK